MIVIKECDFMNPVHRSAIIDLMNDYMADEMGGKLPPYTPETAAMVLAGLEKHPAKLILLAQENDRYVGLVNSYINFGTFAGKPFVNIHDIVVLKTHRGKRIGQQLMNAVAQKSNELGCSKITLEVREDNEFAQRLYRKMGYDECKPPMHFWVKYL